MTDLSDRIGRLSPEKRALLEQRLLRERASATTDTIPRRDPHEPVPLSFSQRRLWFLDQWEPNSPTYNAALPMRLRGPLDVEALRCALERIVERHEAIRTVFRLDGAEPVQVVLDPQRFDLPLVGLEHVPEPERDAELARLLREHARRPFDLARDIMLRATLFRLGLEEHVLLFQEHHIAFDGWSDGIMFAELRELYAAEREGRQAELPELEVQYADFTLWQARRLQGALLDEHESYWRKQLAGAPAALRLPTDYTRPALQTFEGVHRHIALPAEIAEGVRALSRREGVTPFMTLLAVVQTLLYRWTGEDDLLIGTPIANRGRMELEPLIGFFSNTLVLRTRLGGNPTFREVVRRTREVALEAYAHQDLPFEKVVEAARPARNPGVNPLFQVNFRVQTGEPTTLSLPGLEVAPLDVDVGFSRFDLALELQLLPDRITGYFESNVDLFADETITRLSRELEQLLAQVLADPDRPVLSLDVFADGGPERAQSARAAIKSFRKRAQAQATEMTR